MQDSITNAREPGSQTEWSTSTSLHGRLDLARPGQSWPVLVDDSPRGVGETRVIRDQDG